MAIETELGMARKKYGKYFTCHHQAESVLREEIKEAHKELKHLKWLKREIEERLHDKECPLEALEMGERHAKNLIAEAIQVAAMIQKYKETNDIFNGVVK
jgi:hypothetical protein